MATNVSNGRLKREDKLLKGPVMPVPLTAFPHTESKARMQSKKRLTAIEFEAVRPLLGISEERINAAREAMVEGNTLKSVGDKYGWTKQGVGKAVDAVLKAWEKYQGMQSAHADETLIPPGWERVTLVAPAHLIQKFREEIAAAAPKVAHKKPGPKGKKPTDE